MATYLIVKPERIEQELDHIWETLAKTTVRASLFNLIVFNQLSPRTDYTRAIVQKVIDQFPCRTLFVSHDATSSQQYVKTAVSVLAQEDNRGIACDLIDIGVAGSDWERVPYLILPHILPDLPVFLLWAENPTEKHPLFEPLLNLSTRVIFDSESTRDLNLFARLLLKIAKNKEVADLNWARLEGWRDLLASVLEASSKLEIVKKSSHIKLAYNSIETKSFCHPQIQALYLICWLSSRLSIPINNLKETKGALSLSWNKKGTAELIPVTSKGVHPGGIVSLDIESGKNTSLKIARDKKNPAQAIIHLSTKESCEVPSHFILGTNPVGQSLSRELLLKGTSSFFLETLKRLAKL